MNEEKRLKAYLLRSFLLTLLLIGLMQLLISSVMGLSLVPKIENLLGLDGLLTDRSAGSMISVLFRCLLIVIIRSAAHSASFWTQPLFDSTLDSAFGGRFTGYISSLDNQLNNVAVNIYIFRIVLFLLILTIIWCLPYIVGALIFTGVVSKKIRELERIRIARNKEYEKSRNLLLSDIAHDIKTPITTVAGFSRALADDAVPKEQKQEYLEAVYNKSMRVSELVSLLFEYVKLDSEGYKLHRTRTDLCELVRECVAGAYADFEEKDMELNISIPDEAMPVNIDPMQMNRAITNLLTNTVRHNPKGTKVLVDMAPEDGFAVFRISDCGVRIEKEVAVHLFDPFVQGDATRASSSGSGLGLSIAKKIVEMHNGQIRLIQFGDIEKYGKVKTFEIRLLMDK